jgi:hypothetical protein
MYIYMRQFPLSVRQRETVPVGAQGAYTVARLDP